MAKMSPREKHVACLKNMLAWKLAKISHEKEKKLHYEREEASALRWALTELGEE